MICPGCGSYGIKVVDTMPGDDSHIFRRRKCLDCGIKFRTVEIIGNDSDEFNKAYHEATLNKSPFYKDINSMRRSANQTLMEE